MSRIQFFVCLFVCDGQTSLKFWHQIPHLVEHLTRDSEGSGSNTVSSVIISSILLNLVL